MVVCLFCGLGSRGSFVRWGEAFFDLVVIVLGERSCRDCRKKQRKESGLWEAAAPAGRELSRSESRWEVKAEVWWAEFSRVQRPLWRVHCSS